jgi:1-aminocyclopropane-1-carboxylate deaminase/D-cysteine desulfhydrase-like pyridoxal-dependent ACC family enzyme
MLLRLQHKELKKQTNIEFDLLYDPIGWRAVLEHNLSNILYIHQGGLIGNESTLQRYKYFQKHI